MDEEQKEEYAARDYQVQLLSIALNENTILYLPTGSGKTFVAVLLIKCLSQDLEKPYRNGGKRTFFAVNTVALVKQQGDYIARHTHLKVGKYSGNMNVDGWSQEQWEAEIVENQVTLLSAVKGNRQFVPYYTSNVKILNLDQFIQQQVLVLTCQILLDILQHGFLKLEDINLIIFDECHHAVADHCMRRVMKKFENCQKELQPRVLGLSATLLNSNCKSEKVPNEIKNLERTFQAKVATVDDLNVVKEFSTNPSESFIKFKKGYPSSAFPGISSLLSEVLDHIETAKVILESLGPGIFSDENEQLPAVDLHIKSISISPEKREKKRIISILNEIKVMFEDLGLFGGFLATLCGLINLHRRRLKIYTEMGKMIVTGCITHLILIRKIISKELDNYSPEEHITKFSTMKVLSLLETLREIEKSAKPNVSVKELLDARTKGPVRESSGLIFVERRQTAKTLYYILKHAAKYYPDLDSVKPEFVVGIASNPASLESSLHKKQHDEAIKRFRTGECNYLVASDVLEEGVDVPICDLVLKFDLPKTFRSYVQSKGRARHSSSKFMIFVPEDDFGKFRNNFAEFQRVESTLRQILIGKTDSRKTPSDEEIKKILYQENIPPYFSEDKSASVDAISSVSLIHRYCSLLPQDKFTVLNPLWLLDENVKVKLDEYDITVMKKVAYLQLPINSPLRHIVKGIPMENKHCARKAVALIACVILHRMGELGKNDLLPVTHGPEVLNDKCLFPHWKDESNDDGIPGSKKRSRRYSKQVADVLKYCHPDPGGVSYVHHIYQKPVYERPPARDSRGNALYDVLSMDRGYAIISSKKIPKLCDFSIYMRSGEVEVKIGDEGIDEVMLSSKQISELEDFHYMVFFDLLKIGKQFVVVDKSYHKNSYLIAPTRKDSSGKWVIDWEITKQFRELPEVYPVSEEDVRKLVVDDDNFLHEVVTPWYRGELTEWNYIVSRICNDMNAKSDFPTNQYGSYELYFENKYKLKVLRPELPLLEVKAISDRMVCIHPRGVTETFDDTPCRSKRQMMLKQMDLNEHLIPELVTKRLFPATLWLKATALPTIIHRLSFILMAYELRSQICIEANIGTIGPPQGNAWKPLKIEANYESDEESQKPCRTVPSEFFSPREGFHVEHSELNVADIDREVEELSLMDIIQHHKLETEENNPKIMRDVEWVPVEPASVPQNVLHRLCDNHSSGSCLGPELADVLCAITSNSSDDVINLERLETLGDSFLKFAASTYLFLKYPKTDEGRLTSIKGRLISNRNLLYCAQNKSLGGKLKIHSFAPKSDWYPPGFVVPTFMKDKLKYHEGITNNVLFGLTIPEADRRSGILSRETKEDIVRSLEERQSNNIVGKMSSTLETLLDIQNVPDKSLADSVEAMLGAWLLTGGFPAAFRLLGWFGILPSGPNGPAGSWEELIDEETIKSAICDGNSDNEEIKIIGGVIDWGPDCEFNKLVKSTEEIALEKEAAERESSEKSCVTSLTINSNDSELNAERYFEIISIEQLTDGKSESIKKLSDEIIVNRQGCIQNNGSQSCHIRSTGEDKNSHFVYNSEDFRCSRDSLDYSHDSVSLRSGDETDGNENQDEEDFENSSREMLNDLCDSMNKSTEDEMIESEEGSAHDDFSLEETHIDNEWDDSDEKLSDCFSLEDNEDEFDSFDPLLESSSENDFWMSSNSNEGKDDLNDSPSPCKRIKLSPTLPTIDQKLQGKNVSENEGRVVEDDNWRISKYLKGLQKERRICSGISLPSSKMLTLPTSKLHGETWNLNSVDSLLPGAPAIEKLINYEFKNRLLLLQAFTHASFHLNRITECYQRLEFLGDAVLDYVITCHIYETCGKLNPGQLTDLRSALVNNITFASLAVRHGLHRHLLHLSRNLMDVIDSFVEFQVQRNHEVTEECLTLMYEEECKLSEYVEVPKALGDIVESLAGAIFLDSGLSVSTVWKVFYPIMKKEIDAFSKNVPKQPVRELLESDAQVLFLPAQIVQEEIKTGSDKGILDSEGMVMVPVEVREKSTGKTRTFYGFGQRKALAKRAAAKLALRAMAKA